MAPLPLLSSLHTPYYDFKLKALQKQIPAISGLTPVTLYSQRPDSNLKEPLMFSENDKVGFGVRPVCSFNFAHWLCALRQVPSFSKLQVH